MEARRNNSVKRSAILSALCASKEHPSAEELYCALLPSIPELSLATVYRNLSVLESEGLVIRVANVNGSVRYDGRTDRHSHFVCRSCGRVLDADVECDVSPLLREASVHGRLAESCEVSFTGLCDSCAR